MALKRFVARLGLESGGGIALPVKRVTPSGSYQALDTDFFIEVVGSAPDPDIYLPEILSTPSDIVHQRQIVGIENSGTTVVKVWTYGGSNEIDELYRGDVAIYQVTGDYSTWQRISDISIIRQGSIAEGTSVRALNNNSVANDSSFSTISGGTGNTVSTNSTNATISGGELNTIGTLSWRSTVAGGSRNRIDGSHHSVISGGSRNSIFGVAGSASSGYFIGGGSGNGVTGTAQYSSVVGGLGNTAGSPYSAILGGQFNQIRENSTNSVIGGGFRNRIGDGQIAAGSFIGGGYNNVIDSSLAQPSSSIVIAGGSGNYVGGRVDGVFVGGGLSNQGGGSYSFVGGGIANSAGLYGVVVGGTGNSLLSASYSAIVGGRANSIGSFLVDSTYAFIGGGFNNIIDGGCTGSSILGGNSNYIFPSVQDGAIIGSGSNQLSHSRSILIGHGLASRRTDTVHVENLDVLSKLNYNESPVKGQGSGEVVYFGAVQSGVGMTAGFIYEYGGTGTWGVARADGSANASGLLGIALGSTPSSGILLRGFANFNLSSYTSMGVTGGQQYLSKTSTGAFSGTPPGASGDIVRIIGYCVDPVTDTLYFSPDTTWVTRIS
jgi:hypothetical protein